MVDLHVHTTASDGQYAPAALVDKAARAGIVVLAITDHDSMTGLAEAEEAAKKCGVTLVRGIEINIDWHTGEFHLLGLGLSHMAKSLCELVAFLQKNREERDKQMIQKMNNDGVEISYDDLRRIFPNRQIGRPHFASLLVQKKIVKDAREAFEKYIGNGKAWYVERKSAALDDAVRAIKDSGGVAVIAHPLSLHVSWGHLDEIFEDIHKRGVEGLEAYHPSTRWHDCERLESLARKHDMFVTAGSDFHSEAAHGERQLGHSSDGAKIDDRFYYEELLPHLAARKTEAN